MSAVALLLDAYVAARPVDATGALAVQTRAEAAVVLSALPPARSAVLLRHMPPAAAARCLTALGTTEAAEVAAALPIEVTATLLRRSEPAARSALLAVLPAGVGRPLERLLGAKEGTAGAAMDPLVPVLQADASAGDVRTYLRSEFDRLFDYIYIVDADHVLVGVADLQALAGAPDSAPVRQSMREGVEWLRVEMPLDAVQAHPGWQRFDALPVVDSGHRFLGVVRHRRLRQVLREGGTPPADDRAMRTLVALGEVYWLGLCGLMQGLATTAAADRPSSPREEKR